jgi:hypothetical protein
MAPTVPLHTKFLGWITLALGTACLLIVSYAFFGYEEPLSPLTGRLLPAAYRREVQWRVFSPDMVFSGATIPPDTNVIFEIPENTGPIVRRVLFGSFDRDIRYWGYCLPEDYDQTKAIQDQKLPGKVFLSEGERKVREQQYRQKLSEHFSVPENLTEEDLNELRKQPQGRIEHEFEVFEPGSICYIMSQAPLALGIDRDDDELNEQAEHERGTNPLIADTDGDGLTDGCEIRLGTSPLRRDTDGDGLIDGLEDANHNCRYDAGTETDATKWDTDRDGLPDGLMKLGTGHNMKILGEDRNLNGTVDTGETDPKKWSTLGNGISDGQRYYQCLMTGGKNC